MQVFTENPPKGETVSFGQDENGMYWAEIKNQWNVVEHATTRETMDEIHKWIDEHE